MQEFLQYIFSRLRERRPVTKVAANGQEYAIHSDGTLGDPIRDLAPQWNKPTLNLATLAALTQAYQLGLDDLPETETAFQVVDHLTARLVSIRADEFGRRHIWAEAKHSEPASFVFGNYYAPEQFLIAFRSMFLWNDDAMKVQQVCSTVGSAEGVMVSDDGISQEITVKSGTVTRSAITLPAEGISLIPWRTFRDADPVASKFLLRMKGAKDSMPTIALFEIDAKWRLDTVNSIRKYIERAVPGALVLA